MAPASRTSTETLLAVPGGRAPLAAGSRDAPPAVSWPMEVLRPDEQAVEDEFRSAVQFQGRRVVTERQQVSVADGARGQPHRRDACEYEVVRDCVRSPP